ESFQRSASLTCRARSKFLTSAAIRVGKRSALKSRMRLTPLLPSSWLRYSSATVCPSGVIAPMPVMTTRLLMMCSELFFPFADHGGGALPQLGDAYFQEAILPHRLRLCRHEDR